MALVRRTTPQSEAEPREEPTDPVAALSASDPGRRHRAVLELHGVTSAVPALLAGVGTETDAVVREAMLTVLAERDTPEVARALAVHLDSDDASLRTAVVEALAAMPTGVPPLLPALLADDDPDVRLMTVRVLADLPVPDAASWLVRMITDDQHPNVVAAAIDALLPAAGEEHIPVLEQARDRFPNDPFLRFTVDAMVPGLHEAGEGGVR